MSPFLAACSAWNECCATPTRRNRWMPTPSYSNPSYAGQVCARPMLGGLWGLWLRPHVCFGRWSRVVRNKMSACAAVVDKRSNAVNWMLS